MKRILFTFVFCAGILGASVLECRSEEDKISGCVEVKELYFDSSTGEIVDSESIDDKYDNNYRGYSETPYKNGKRDGVFKVYNTNKQLQEEIPYENGKIEGIAKEYLDGNLYSETPYKNGKKEGIAKQYYDGNLYSETPYKNGKTEGMGKIYHENEIRITLYRNGLYEGIIEEDGVVRKYDEGNLIAETPYKNGKRHGIAKEYNTEGDLISETPYINDKKEGIQTVYYGIRQAGERYKKGGRYLLAEITYQNDKAIDIKCKAATYGPKITNAHLRKIQNNFHSVFEICPSW